MPVTRGYCFQIVNNTASQAEINSIVIVNGEWRPRLPSLLSAQGGAAIGEAYGVEWFGGSFTVDLPGVAFWCAYGISTAFGPYFSYGKSGPNKDEYDFDPKPVATNHGTTATVTLNLVAIKKN